jgi:serine/threonine-protein kinase RsbW
MSPITIELTIDSRLENVALVGVAFNKICESAGMDALECYQMELCLVEAVTNCIKHAYGSRPGNNVSVKVTLDERNLELQIRDKGPPAAGVFAGPSTLEFDPNDLQQVPTSGMGVFIIQSIMDGVEYHREGDTNILTLTKELKARSPA